MKIWIDGKPMIFGGLLWNILENDRRRQKPSIKEYKAIWYQRNKARLREKNRLNLIRWRKANPQKVHAQRARHYARHRNKILVRKKQWNRENQGRIREYTRKYRAQNPEHWKQYQKNYYAGYYQKNYSRIKKNVLRWEKINREARRRIKSKHRKKCWQLLTDGAVKQYFYKWNRRKPTNQEIIKCKQRIQIKRAAKVVRMLHSSQQLLKAFQN